VINMTDVTGGAGAVVGANTVYTYTAGFNTGKDVYSGATTAGTNLIHVTYAVTGLSTTITSVGVGPYAPGATTIPYNFAKTLTFSSPENMYASAPATDTTRSIVLSNAIASYTEYTYVDSATGPTIVAKNVATFNGTSGYVIQKFTYTYEALDPNAAKTTTVLTRESQINGLVASAPVAALPADISATWWTPAVTAGTTLVWVYDSATKLLGARQTVNSTGTLTALETYGFDTVNGVRNRVNTWTVTAGAPTAISSYSLTTFIRW
jgi:hypothetical protein